MLYMKSLGDRMKSNYEHRARAYLTRRTPVIVRVDGKAFRSYTRGMDRPYDETFTNAIDAATIALASQMAGFKLGYIQSDEASFLLTDFDRIETEAWFDYNKAKVESVSSSIMTAEFNKAMKEYTDRTAYFDSRSFNIPASEVANYFL